MKLRLYACLFLLFMFKITFVVSYNQTPKDSVYVYLNLEDLKDVEVKNSYFEGELWYELSSNNKFSNESWSEMYPDQLVNIQTRSNKDIEKFGELGWGENLMTAYRTVYAVFDHNWNLENYPFDKQELNISFQSSADSMFVRVFPKKPISSYYDALPNLKEGFVVKEIISENDYNVQSNDLFWDGEVERPIVLETLTYKVILERQGAWLPIKLFIGSIAAFFISWMVFFITTKDFGSRVELSVGAIFGAVGNLSYVESIIPDVQVLTKADMLNNFVIFMIVFNILLIIIQKNDKIYWKFFESNWNASVYSIYLFTAISSLILYWSVEDLNLGFIISAIFLAILGFYIIRFFQNQRQLKK